MTRAFRHHNRHGKTTPITIRHIGKNSALSSIVVGALLCVAGDGSATHPDGGLDMTHVDRVILSHAFFLETRTGSAQPLSLTPRFSPFTIDRHGNPLQEGDPLYRFYRRGYDFFVAFGKLMQDPGFASRVADAEARIIAEVLPISTARGYCQPRIIEYLGTETLAALIEAVGPPSVTWSELPSYEAALEERYFAEDSCVGSGSTPDAGDLPTAVTPFHCCGNGLVTTNLGGEPYASIVARHHQLMEDDLEYRLDYYQILAPFAEQAAQLKRPFDLVARQKCDAITREWRVALTKPVNQRPSIVERLTR